MTIQSISSFETFNTSRSDTPLRICLVVRYFTIGGLERVVVGLANGLAILGIETRVIIIETGKRNALVTELAESVDLVCLEGSVLVKMRSLRKLTKGYITHLHFGDGYIHPMYRLALLGHQHLLITYHSVYSHLRNVMQTVVDRYISHQFKAVIAVSERVKEYCTREIGISESKIHVIYNGIKTGTARTIPEGGGHRPIVLVCVASLYPHKNQRVLIRALAAVHQMGYNVELVLVGDGPEMARLFKLARDLHIDSSITWHGAIWRKQTVQSILDEADIFVTASKWEGFSISLLEAMESSLAIVASDIQPHHEALQDSALYFSADDVMSLAQSIVRLADHPKYRAELGLGVRKLAEKFDNKTCVDQHVALYKTTLIL